MIERIKSVLKKLSKEDIDAELKFDGCKIIFNERKISLEGKLDLEVTDK